MKNKLTGCNILLSLLTLFCTNIDSFTNIIVPIVSLGLQVLNDE